MQNPLLQKTNLPPFSAISAPDIKPAIKRVLKENREQVRKLEKLEDISWKTLIEPLEIMEERLANIWSPVRHLNSVKSSDDLRKEYNRCIPLLSKYQTDIGQNTKLNAGYQYIASQDSFTGLDKAKKKTITDALLHFKLSGVNLSGKNKKRFLAIEQRLSELQTKFDNNILDSTQDWDLIITDENRLKGLPDYAMAMLKQYAKQKSLSGYRATLDMPCYIAVITYADDRQLRKEIYTAYTTRASDQGEGKKKWDNAANMVEILQLRQEKAELLCLNNYLDFSLKTKMVGSAQKVEAFLTELADKSLPVAIKEYRELEEFAKDQGLQNHLQAWDVAYFSEKLKQQQYAISEEDLKPYFSDNRVIAGMFEIVEKLFCIKIIEITENIDIWHKDVRFFRIFDKQQNKRGEFFLDLYARKNKRGGAWMDECKSRYVIQGVTQTPVAYLTCNLTPPIGSEPALFTHEEVITLFHEFGHGLHHLLTLVDIPEVSGINGVEWDAVELPSQFLENYAWQKEALDLFARHYQTNEPLPPALYKKMIKSKNFQSAMQMVRQLEFSLFDIKLHQHKEIKKAEQIQQILDKTRQKVAVMIPPQFNKFQNSFSHIFSGGYAAGYYSYKWAEVLSSDVFSIFEKNGIFNIETGKRFLKCILQNGGVQPAAEGFRCFMGREPDISALLRHNGIE